MYQQAINRIKILHEGLLEINSVTFQQYIEKYQAKNDLIILPLTKLKKECCIKRMYNKIAKKTNVKSDIQSEELVQQNFLLFKQKVELDMYDIADLVKEKWEKEVQKIKEELIEEVRVNSKNLQQAKERLEYIYYYKYFEFNIDAFVLQIRQLQYKDYMLNLLTIVQNIKNYLADKIIETANMQIAEYKQIK